MVNVPRLVLAAPASGAGKTTVAVGLMAGFAARGLRVSGHKVGPDYIDPGYHAVATGRPGRNLDAFLCAPQTIAPLFVHGAAGADLAVIEGVMGLFDGRGGTDEASTAHVARLLAAPVVLVVDAAAQAGSVAALVHGFTTYDARVTVAGVILNRVGSDRHEELLRAALVPLGVQVFGALRRDPAVVAPSRHLGLVPAVERADAARAAVRRLGALVARHCDLDGLLGLARSAPPLGATAWSPAEVAAEGVARPPVTGRPRVAMANGSAFSFGYAETAELLTAAGAEVVAFDPLRDTVLPEGTRGLVIGGGFPEMYAGELAANAPLRAEVARLARSGAPVAAECAGLLFLSRSLDGAQMCGVLPTEARMTDRLTLGYRTARAADGTQTGGHEFHRTRCTPRAGRRPAWWLDGRPEGFRTRGVHASYLHVHPAGAPRVFTRVAAEAAAR